MVLRTGQAASTVPFGRSDREGNGQGSAGRDHRPRAGKAFETVLHPADRERGSGSGARDDAAPALRRNLLGLGRACVTDHGLIHPDSSVRLLGKGETGTDAGTGGAQDYVRSRLILGTDRTRL